VSRELVTGFLSCVLLQELLISKGYGESKSFVLQAYVAQVGIWDVTHENPPDFEHTLPLVRSPDGTAPRIVHGGQHFCHTAKVATVTNISTTKPNTKGRKGYLALTLKKR